MRTEQLLRDTLADLGGQARTPEVTLTRVLAGMPARPRSRRRGFVLVLAAIVLLALAVAVPTILVNRVGEPVGRVPGNWNLNHRVELPPGNLITMQLITPDSESTTFGLADDPNAGAEGMTSCQITLWARGRGDPSADSPERTPVTINGRPGFWADDTDQVAIWGVSWEYEPGAFAQAACDGGQAEEVAAAERVRLEPVPVRLPFRLRSLPDGYEARVVVPPVTNVEGLSLGGVQFRSAVEDPARPAFDVAMFEGRTEVPTGIAGWETITVAGRPAVLSALDQKVCLNLDAHSLCVYGSGGSELPRSIWAQGQRELLVDLAGRVAVADDLDDPTSWFPANRAIPG